MAELAFISDVHSNLEALQEVLKRVAGMPLYCLGDLVGYGASPNEVLDLLRERRVTALMGNHDLAAVTGDTAMFNSRAAIAAKWTTKELTGKNLEYLHSLPRTLRLRPEGVPVFLAHGSPDDPVWEYVEPRTHSQLFGYYLSKVRARLMGLGHTHVPYVWAERAGAVFNPGSVGQPRDGDRRAAYAVVTVKGEDIGVEGHRVEYDVETAASKIRRAGLPESLAARLYSGA